MTDRLLATQLLPQLPEPTPQEMVQALTVGPDGNHIAEEETPQETQLQEAKPHETKPLETKPLPLLEGHNHGNGAAAEILPAATSLALLRKAG